MGSIVDNCYDQAEKWFTLTDKEAELQRSIHLPKATQLLCSRTKIWAQVLGFSKPNLAHTIILL